MIGAIKKTDKEIIREQSQIILNKTKQIADLEKENAELKSGCGMCYRKDKEQLTNAKETIKKLLDAYKYVIRYEEYADREIVKEAEQFLSEVEK